MFGANLLSNYKMIYSKKLSKKWKRKTCFIYAGVILKFLDYIKPVSNAWQNFKAKVYSTATSEIKRSEIFVS